MAASMMVSDPPDFVGDPDRAVGRVVGQPIGVGPGRGPAQDCAGVLIDPDNPAGAGGSRVDAVQRRDHQDPVDLGRPGIVRTTRPVRMLTSTIWLAPRFAAPERITASSGIVLPLLTPACRSARPYEAARL